jgi:hypothetical protein
LIAFFNFIIGYILKVFIHVIIYHKQSFF